MKEYEHLRQRQQQNREAIEAFKDTNYAKQITAWCLKGASEQSQEEVEARLVEAKRFGEEWGSTNGIMSKEGVSEEILYSIAIKSMVVSALSEAVSRRMDINRQARPNHYFGRFGIRFGTRV